MATSRAHVFISGRVQAVSFRYYTYHEALRLGVAGWVRNLWDGRVEAVFEGEKPAVDAILEWCRSGPPAATVNSLEVDWEEKSDGMKNFEVRATAGAD
jgi:acylphosphatase